MPLIEAAGTSVARIRPDSVKNSTPPERSWLSMSVSEPSWLFGKICRSNRPLVSALDRRRHFPGADVERMRVRQVVGEFVGEFGLLGSRDKRRAQAAQNRRCGRWSSIASVVKSPSRRLPNRFLFGFPRGSTLAAHWLFACFHRKYQAPVRTPFASLFERRLAGGPRSQNSLEAEGLCTNVWNLYGIKYSIIYLMRITDAWAGIEVIEPNCRQRPLKRGLRRSRNAATPSL